MARAAAAHRHARPRPLHRGPIGGHRPALNTDCQSAIRRYQDELVCPEPANAGFQALSLEAVVTALGKAGADLITTRLTERYLDFGPVHAVLEASFEGPPTPA